MPSVHLVQNWYVKSFHEILEFEDIKSIDKKNLIKLVNITWNFQTISSINYFIFFRLIEIHNRFCETLVKIRNRHADVVPTMAKGVIELRESHPVDQTIEHRIHYFLDRFYMSRIGIRMLINQHSITLKVAGFQKEMK